MTPFGVAGIRHWTLITLPPTIRVITSRGGEGANGIRITIVYNNYIMLVEPKIHANKCRRHNQNHYGKRFLYQVAK